MSYHHAKAFVSHSSKDIPIVDKIVADLESNGVSVWYDKFEIRAGDDIVDKVNEGLKDSEYFLLILSPNALSSSWVKEETSFAVLQQIAFKGIFVIPVLIQDCDIPPLLRHRRYVDFRKSYDEGMEELLKIFEENDKVLKDLSKNKIAPWPDISQPDEEFVYLYSTRFDKVFKLPLKLDAPVSDAIDYAVKTLHLPYRKDIPELGLRLSFSYAIVHNNQPIVLSKSPAEAGVTVGDTIYLRINATYEDLWAKELREMWSGNKLYEVGGALMREQELKQALQKRGQLTRNKVKKLADNCFADV
jgi:hypothetical protein